MVTNDKSVIERSIADFVDSATIKRVIPAAIDLLGFNSLLTIPLIAGDDVIGAADLHRDHPFTSEDCERFDRILGSLTAALGRKRLEDDLEKSEERFRRLSLVDELTGLYNRRGFFALAEHQMRLASREGKCLTLVYCDVDGLKAINDRFGHAAGDRVLRDAGAVLKATFRGSDIVARLGGDEYAVLTTGSGEDVGETVGARLAQAVNEAHESDEFGLSISFGVASCPSEDRKSVV